MNTASSLTSNFSSPVVLVESLKSPQTNGVRWPQRLTVNTKSSGLFSGSFLYTWCAEVAEWSFKLSLSLLAWTLKALKCSQAAVEDPGRWVSLCSTYLSQRGLTAAELEAIAVLQTCLPSRCPRDDTNPPLPPLGSAQCLPLPQGAGVTHPSAATRRPQAAVQPVQSQPLFREAAN